MSTDEAMLMTLQSAGLFLVVWIVLRLVPSIPANTRAWIWRFALLKPLMGLLPLAVVSLHVLPASTPVLIQGGSPSNVTVADVPSAVSAPLPKENAPDLLLVIWVLGSTAVAGKGILERWRARQIARAAESVSSPILQGLLDELVLRGSKGQSIRPVQLLTSSEAKTAMLVGGLKPAIVLPTSVVDGQSLDDARLMIAHELGHLFRHDLEWLGLAWVVQSVFFFNPLVWLAVRASYEAHESATDRYAIELADISAPKYAEMLVRTLLTVRPSLVPGAVFMSGSYRSIRRRLEAMKHFRSSSNPWRKAAFGAFAATVLCLTPAYRLAQASPPQGHQGGGSSPQGSGIHVPGDEPWCWVPPLDRSKPDNLSCDFNQYDVRQALVKVLQRHGKSFRIAPQVHGKVTLSVRNVTLGMCLENMTRQVGAGFSVEKGVYVITNRPQSATPAPVPAIALPPQSAPVIYNDVSIDLECEKADAREILRQLFRHSKASYSIAPDVQGTITISLKHVPFETALKNVLREVHSTFHIEGGVYMITVAEKPPLE